MAHPEWITFKTAFRRIPAIIGGKQVLYGLNDLAEKACAIFNEKRDQLRTTIDFDSRMGIQASDSIRYAMASANVKSLTVTLDKETLTLPELAFPGAALRAAIIWAVRELATDGIPKLEQPAKKLDLSRTLIPNEILGGYEQGLGIEAKAELYYAGTFDAKLSFSYKIKSS